MSENVNVENETTEILEEQSEQTQEVTNAETEPTSGDDTPVIEENTDDTPEGEAVQTDEEVQTVEKKKNKKSIPERLKELQRQTWEAREAQRKAEESIERAKLLEQNNKPQEPNIDDFDNDASYQEAVKTHYAKQAETEAQKKAQEIIERQRSNRQHSDQMAKWDFQRSQEVEKNPDFEVTELKVANAVRSLLPQQQHAQFAELITTSEQGVQMLNYFGKNPTEIEKLSNLSPIGAAKEFGKLEAKLSSQPKKKITSAPAPVRSEQGSGSATKDLSRMSQAEYSAYMNKMESGR